MSRLSGRKLAVVGLLYVIAAVLRLVDLQAPGTLVEREFRSLIIARSIYFELAPPAEDWRAEAARVSWEREGHLEPPLTEALVAGSYLLAGGEIPWISRVLCSAFWFAGGWFLLALARRFVRESFALIALAFYLLAPLGVILSRSFQPDALMIAAALMSLHASLLHAEAPTRRRFLWAVFSAGFGVFVKPLIVFMVCLGFAAPLLHERGLRRYPFARLVLFSLLIVAPAACWYGYSMLRPLAGTESAMVHQLSVSSSQRYLLGLGFWLDWLKLALRMVGPVTLPLGLVGLALMARSRERLLLLGAWASYPFFGLSSSRLIVDHGYYHAQLIPLVGLGLAVVAQRLWAWERGRVLVAAVATVLILLWLGAGIREIQRDHRRSYREDPELCRTIGEAVEHSTRTVYVSPHYGRPLEYFGLLAGVPWPKALPDDAPAGTEPASVEERIRELSFTPEFFIVTNLERFERIHADLRQWLEDNCSMVSEEAGYRIWGACSLAE